MNSHFGTYVCLGSMFGLIKILKVEILADSVDLDNVATFVQ